MDRGKSGVEWEAVIAKLAKVRLFSVPKTNARCSQCDQIGRNFAIWATF